jgi:hypothetical protein
MRSEFPAVDVPRVPADGDELDREIPEEAARHVPSTWQIGDLPIRHMVRLLEMHGVLGVLSPQ